MLSQRATYTAFRIGAIVSMACVLMSAAVVMSFDGNESHTRSGDIRDSQPAPLGGAAVIFDNGSPDGESLISNFEGVIDGEPRDRTLADDFVLEGDAVLTGVEMRGVWASGSQAPGPLTHLRVRIWLDDGTGQPVTPIQNTVTDQNVDFTGENTGETYFGFPEVRYFAELAEPVSLEGNQWYWISVKPAGTTDEFLQLTSRWKWLGYILGSCVDPQYCGGSSPECWCDESCCDFMDCCHDKHEMCGGCWHGVDLFGEAAHIEFPDENMDWPTKYAPGGSIPSHYDIAFKLYGEFASDCPWDLTGDGQVDGADLGQLLALWGPCADCDDCPPDFNGDCEVDGADLGQLLANWGDCPEPPPPTGGCCLGHECHEMTASECNAQGGLFLGIASSCQGDPCELKCGGATAGECCMENLTPYCNDKQCCELICQMDPYCCGEFGGHWDIICAAQANRHCAVCQ